MIVVLYATVPRGSFFSPDALAMHKFGHRQGSATMHQWFGEWSATFASNRHASPRHRDIEENFNACIEIFSRCYATVPRGSFFSPDALAMHKFGHRQGSATMHQWFDEWSATYGSHRHASLRHPDIGKNFNACIEIFSRCFDAKYHRRYIAEQRRAVGEHSAMYTKVKNVPDPSATHQRHIGDTAAMLV